MMLEKDFHERLRTIRGEWKALRGDRQRKAMQRKEGLLEELVRLSKHQIQADAAEVREGRQELHDGR